MESNITVGSAEREPTRIKRNGQTKLDATISALGSQIFESI
jgi:hypothetical protein